VHVQWRIENDAENRRRLNGNKCSTFEFLNGESTSMRTTAEEIYGTGLADFIYLYIYFQDVMYDIYSKFTVQQAEPVFENTYFSFFFRFKKYMTFYVFLK